MAPPVYYNANGTWKEADDLYVDLGPTRKTASIVYYNANGTWRECPMTSTVTIYGAKNETVTYSGTASGTVTLNSSGQATVALRGGSYSFTAGISGRTASVTVSGNTTVMLRPAKIVYWYGVEAVAFGSITGNDYSPEVKRNANSITVSTYRSGEGTNNRAFYTNTAVDVTNYSSLKGILEGMAANAWYKLGAATSRTTYDASSGAAVAVNKPSVTTVSLSGITGNRYIGIMGDSYGRAGDIAATIHAIWME